MNWSAIDQLDRWFDRIILTLIHLLYILLSLSVSSGMPESNVICLSGQCMNSVNSRTEIKPIRPCLYTHKHIFRHWTLNAIWIHIRWWEQVRMMHVPCSSWTLVHCVILFFDNWQMLTATRKYTKCFLYFISSTLFEIFHSDSTVNSTKTFWYFAQLIRYI